MVGQSFIGGKYWDINQEPVDIDKAGFTLEISSEYSKIEWVSFAIWATDASISYTIDKNFELDCDDTKAKGVIGKLKGRWAKKKCIKHNKDLKRWVQRNPSEAFEYEDYQVTEEFRKKGSLPQPVSGMQGFRVDADRNMRLQCQRDEYDTKNAIQKVRMGTWWDTQLYRITYFQLIFVISPDKCVKLYSECNFQGEELASICETTPAPALAA